MGRILLAAVAFATALHGVAYARPWQKVVTPRFTLITDATDYASRELLTDFSDYLRYLDKAMAMDSNDLKPLTLVLFDNDSEYRPFESRLSNGKTAESVEREREFYAGSQTGFGPTWSVISAVVQDAREKTRFVVFSGGAEWYLGSLDQPMPLAVRRGLTSVFSAFKRGVTHGIAGEPIPSFVQVLQAWPLMPVEKLLEDDNYEGVVMRNELVEYASESWALMHYLMFSKTAIDRGAFGKFWHALRAGRTPKAALVDALGAEGAANIDVSLRAYIHGQRYTVQVPMGDEKDNHDPYQPASELDVQLALTKAAMISGQFATAAVHSNSAVAAANGQPEAYDLKAELLAAMPSDSDAPRAAVQEAVERGSKSAFSLCNWARYQWEDAGGYTATPAASRLAVNGAEKAANADLNYSPAFDLLSQALPYADHLTAADEKFLAYGRQRFPRDRWILVGVAAFHRKHGKLALAQSAEKMAVSDDPALDATQRATVTAYLTSSGAKPPSKEILIPVPPIPTR